MDSYMSVKELNPANIPLVNTVMLLVSKDL